jgi:hypothetical protein
LARFYQYITADWKMADPLGSFLKDLHLTNVGTCRAVLAKLGITVVLDWTGLEGGDLDEAMVRVTVLNQLEILWLLGSDTSVRACL